ncbi:3',5'-cyclic-nucleotide phosphodiesterase PDE2 [Aspergillus mulundensis]|uniref:Phosphodiesterase n=1 Tax=Aspergillus mulundensis TaxID=1810919 RepID=A0A3D8RF83_9EURO|nr:Phosphodiesterase [Aspergillus mulundensis]RDW72531.1 Phosphodiesterase [Aspergillus mulundensis]
MGVPDPVDVMDHIDCAAIYIDPRIQSERWVYQGSPPESLIFSDEPESLRSDIDVLLGISRRMYLCQAGASLVTKLAELSESHGNSCTPIFAFLDIDLHTEEPPSLSRRSTSRGSWQGPPSPAPLRRGFTFSSQNEGSSDLRLLSGLSTDIQVHDGPNLVIPVAILRPPSREPTSAGPGQQQPYVPHPQHISRCLDAGAVDVLTGPLDKIRIQSLVVHAYRTRKIGLKEQSRFMSRRKLRKHSWVGVHDEQPYSYLREAMVSKLMKGICNPEDVVEELHDGEYFVSEEREDYVKQRLGQWDFEAHEFDDDELVFAAHSMLQHAFTIPELEEWKLTPGELRTFLLACRASYNSFVLYHNFRHAIDVLQSIFCFLLHIGALPPYRSIGHNADKDCPIANMLKPFDALTLLISAIGHDVGHPGVNNFFLVKLNAPLAQLYNDNSVLEAFHCAAFSQILRRYWPAAFKDKTLRKLLISSILATDMGVHQKFMERLGALQEKYSENNRSTDGWKPQDIEMYKTLVCGLLIKCADISNVARPWEVAEKWTKILQEEFANQGEMEKEVGMETALFGGPPELGNVYKLATGQMGFMSIFALPLFEGVSDILAGLRFTVDHIRRNHTRWHYLADLERGKPFLTVEPAPDGHVSPRSHSPSASFRDPQATPKVPTVTPPTPVTSHPKPTKSFPAKEPQQQRIDEADDYFGPQRSARTSVDSAYNENQISPVVSPDTPGPSTMDITGDSRPVDEPSRKSSSAVPDSSPVSIVEPMPTKTPISGDSQSPSSAITYDSAVDGAAERANGARSVYRNHANTASSGCTSAPSNSQRNSCTRTHSISTHSNTRSPISPSTNATSVLSADSDDQDHIYHREIPRSDYADWNHRSPRGGSPKHGGDRGSENTLHSGHSQLFDGSDKNHSGNGSSSHSIGTGSSTGQSPHWDELGTEQPTRKLPKRRSRLRLAFWKRKNYHSNNHEVSGESR